MGEPQFTPGPWVLGSEGLAGTVCVTADGDKVVCELDGFGCDVSPDARLIAAAPALYEALSNAAIQLRHYNFCHKHLESTDKLLTVIDELLSLALGEGQGE